MQVMVPYKPNRGVADRPNQWDFHQARHKYDYRICICGQRAGKTIANVGEGVTWAHKYPGSVGWLGEPNYPMVKRIMLPAFSTVLGRKGEFAKSPLVESYNRSDHLITWTNTSQTWLGSMDEPEANEGPTYDYVGLDEARLVRKVELAIEVLNARLSGTPALPKHIHPEMWITTTASPVRSPLWQLFALESKERLPSIALFSWEQADNKALSKHYVQKMDASIKDPAKRDAFLKGKWPTTGTGVLPFSYLKHVIEDWDLIPEGDQLLKVIYGVDWGYAPDPFVIVVILVDRSGRCYVVDEFYEIEFDPDKRWEAARDMVEKWGKGTFWCGKDRPEFIRKFKDHRLDARPYDCKREDAIDQLISLCYDWDGSPRMFWWHECKNAIYEASQYDPESGEDDHTIDATWEAVGSTVRTPGKSVAIDYAARRDYKRRRVA